MGRKVCCRCSQPKGDRVKVAVTGANGFVGRHVLRELAGRGIEAVAICRSLGVSLPDLPSTEVVALDINNPPSDPFNAVGCPDVLIHLAWGGLPNYHSQHHFEHELPTHYRFLKALICSGLRSLVVTGTCAEYGMQSGPLGESMEPRPASPYSFAKDSLRRQLQFLRVTHPFNLTWARLFYLYGDGQAETSLFPQLRRAVVQGRDVFEMSGGEQLRDYLPVTEVARYLVFLATSGKDVGVVNVCSGRPTSVRRLVEEWIRANSWQITIDLGRYPYPDYEPMAFWGDRSKLESLLDQQ